MSAPVDVLEGLASLAVRNRINGRSDSAKEIESIRAAVAELMEAAAHASVILRAKGGLTAGERDEAVARLNAAVSAAKGGV